MQCRSSLRDSFNLNTRRCSQGSANGLGYGRPSSVAPALCGSCDARDGERIRSRGLSRPGWREIAGTLGQLQAGRQAGNGMACSRAKARLNMRFKPNFQVKGFQKTERALQQLERTLDRQPGAVGGEAPRRHV